MRGSQEVEVDNQCVVIHNQLLLKMFQAHINVEFCNSVKSIKYICVEICQQMQRYGCIHNNQRNGEQHPKNEIL